MTQSMREASYEFASATGWGRSAWYFASDPLPQTLGCDRAWRGESRSLADDLVTIQTIESALSLLAPRQLAALVERYGFDTRAVRYFVGRAERSARDAALSEAALTSLLPVVAPEALVGHAESVTAPTGSCSTACRCSRSNPLSA
jgi:hypothetical protein